MALVASASHRRVEYKRTGELIITSHITVELLAVLSTLSSNDIMKFKIACVLLLAVAAQTQLIGVYAGYPSLLPAATDAAPSRAKRQVADVWQKILKDGPRWGRSVNEMIEPAETSPDTLEKSIDAAPSRNKRQLQLGYLSTRRNRGRTGRSLINEVEPTGTDYEIVDVAPSSTTYQTQLQYGGNRPGRSLNNLSWSTA